MKIKYLFLTFLIFGLWPCGSAGAGQTGRPAESYEHYLRALMFENQGNFVSAAEELDKAIALTPQSAYLHRTRAELSLRLGQVNQAAEEIELANNLDPSDVKALILAGQISWALGQTQKAEEKLKRAVALAPDEAEAIVSLAGTLVTKDPQEAVKLYKDFLIRHPGEIAIIERLAQIYQNMGETDNARGQWEEVLALSPGYARAHLALAQIAEVNFDTHTAISHYEAVTADDPSNLPLLLRIGELRYRNNEMAKAFEAFSRAKSIAPDSSSANFWLALLSEHRGDWQEATRLLEQVSSQMLDPGVLLRLSYYYSQAGRFKDAVRVLKLLSVSQPNNTDFLGYLAIAYEQDKQHANAEKTIKRIIELEPQNPEAHFQLATIYDRAGKFSKAEDELKKAVSLKPDYHVALNYLGYSYADRDVNLSEAERHLTVAIGLDPENPAYMDSFGWLYYRQGKLQKATDFLREATLRTRDSVVWDHLGSVEAAKGELVDAALCWDESLRVDPTYKEAAKKISAVEKKLSKKERINLFVKRASIHFADVQSAYGLCKVTVCESKPCFHSKAQFSYFYNGELMLEIPGPLTGPVMQLKKKHGYPAQYGALHPLFQTVEYYATRAIDRIEALLSADAFRLIVLDDFQKNVQERGNEVAASDGIVSVRFVKPQGNVREIEWIGEAGGDTLKIGPYSLYSKDRAAVLPSFLEWHDKRSGFMIRIDFLNPIVARSSQPVQEKKK